MDKVLVWGTGNIYKKYFGKLNDLIKIGEIEILALINDENSPEYINGYKVIRKENIKNYQFDKIIIMAEGSALESIFDDITVLQIESRKIITLSWFRRKYLNEISSKNGTPCEEVLALVEKKKREKKSITIAEIGTDIGATAVEVCKLLTTDDVYYCFDFIDKICEVIAYLEDDEICCHLIGMGNTHRIYDSYCWSLCKLLFEMRDNKVDGLFDIVYLDGAHSFAHDGLACCILKELLKPDGFIVLDDVYWSYGISSTCNPNVFPAVKGLYTDEQIHDYQVKRVVNAFMINDVRFEQVYITNGSRSSRAIFKKVS